VSDNKKYLYVGDHAGILSGGLAVAPGDPVPAGSVDTSDPHDQHLLDDGLLIEPAQEKKEAKS
jgi:hypothetical protein